jgi:hypothetical protein
VIDAKFAPANPATGPRAPSRLHFKQLSVVARSTPPIPKQGMTLAREQARMATALAKEEVEQ